MKQPLGIEELKCKQCKVCLAALLAIAAMLFGCASYQTGSPTLQIHGWTGKPLDVPLHVGSGGQLSSIDLTVEGHLLHLGVDTGSNDIAVSIAPQALKRLSVHYLLKHYWFGDANGRMHRVRTFVIPSATIAGIKLTQVAGVEEPRSFKTLDGLVGNKFLQHFRVLFDYSAEKLVLYPVSDSSASLPPDLRSKDWIRVPFQHTDIGIIVKAALVPGEKQLSFLFDTGCVVASQGSYLGMLRPGQLPKKDIVGNMRISQLANKPLPVARAQHLIVDGADFGPLSFLIYNWKQPPVDGFLGRNVMDRYQVFIDFQHQVMYIRSEPG